MHIDQGNIGSNSNNCTYKTLSSFAENKGSGHICSSMLNDHLCATEIEASYISLLKLHYCQLEGNLLTFLVLALILATASFFMINLIQRLYLSKILYKLRRSTSLPECLTTSILLPLTYCLIPIFIEFQAGLVRDSNSSLAVTTLGSTLSMGSLSVGVLAMAMVVSPRIDKNQFFIDMFFWILGSIIIASFLFDQRLRFIEGLILVGCWFLHLTLKLQRELREDKDEFVRHRTMDESSNMLEALVHSFGGAGDGAERRGCFYEIEAEVNKEIEMAKIHMEQKMANKSMSVGVALMDVDEKEEFQGGGEDEEEYCGKILVRKMRKVKIRKTRKVRKNRLDGEDRDGFGTQESMKGQPSQPRSSKKSPMVLKPKFREDGLQLSELDEKYLNQEETKRMDSLTMSPIKTGEEDPEKVKNLAVLPGFDQTTSKFKLQRFESMNSKEASGGEWKATETSQKLQNKGNEGTTEQPKISNSMDSMKQKVELIDEGLIRKASKFSKKPKNSKNREAKKEQNRKDFGASESQKMAKSKRMYRRNNRNSRSDAESESQDESNYTMESYSEEAEESYYTAYKSSNKQSSSSNPKNHPKKARNHHGAKSTSPKKNTPKNGSEEEKSKRASKNTQKKPKKLLTNNRESFSINLLPPTEKLKNRVNPENRMGYLFKSFHYDISPPLPAPSIPNSMLNLTPEDPQLCRSNLEGRVALTPPRALTVENHDVSECQRSSKIAKNSKKDEKSQSPQKCESDLKKVVRNKIKRYIMKNRTLDSPWIKSSEIDSLIFRVKFLAEKERKIGNLDIYRVCEWLCYLLVLPCSHGVGYDKLRFLIWPIFGIPFLAFVGGVQLSKESIYKQETFFGRTGVALLITILLIMALFTLFLKKESRPSGHIKTVILWFSCISSITLVWFLSNILARVQISLSLVLGLDFDFLNFLVSSVIIWIPYTIRLLREQRIVPQAPSYQPLIFQMLLVFGFRIILTSLKNGIKKPVGLSLWDRGYDLGRIQLFCFILANIFLAAVSYFMGKMKKWRLTRGQGLVLVAFYVSVVAVFLITPLF